MNTIIRRMIVNIFILCFLTSALAQSIASQGGDINIQTSVTSVFITLAVGILICILLKDINNFKIARLIRENFILKVKTAVIREISDKDCHDKHIEDTDIFVSYFGILFNGKIVKFNQDGDRLLAMSIGNDFISFTYGNEKKIQNLRIVRPNIEPEAMEEMINRFRFETGITPTKIEG